MLKFQPQLHLNFQKLSRFFTFLDMVNAKIHQVLFDAYVMMGILSNLNPLRNMEIARMQKKVKTLLVRILAYNKQIIILFEQTFSCLKYNLFLMNFKDAPTMTNAYWICIIVIQYMRTVKTRMAHTTAIVRQDLKGMDLIAM